VPVPVTVFFGQIFARDSSSQINAIFSGEERIVLSSPLFKSQHLLIAA
jgi:hypothetical protein